MVVTDTCAVQTEWQLTLRRCKWNVLNAKQAVCDLMVVAGPMYFYTMGCSRDFEGLGLVFPICSTPIIIIIIT